MSVICRNNNRRQEIECINCDCGLVLPYIPEIGHSVVATRKVKSSLYINTIAGPVVDIWSNACRILNNPGTPSEGDFRLHFNEWDFRFLHETETE